MESGCILSSIEYEEKDLITTSTSIRADFRHHLLIYNTSWAAHFTRQNADLKLFTGCSTRNWASRKAAKIIQHIPRNRKRNSVSDGQPEEGAWRCGAR